MRMYAEGVIDELFANSQNSIKRTIESESEDYLLNVNQTEYCEQLSSQYHIEFPTLHFESVQADSYEREISANNHPSAWHVRAGEKHKRDIVRFHVPYSGDISLLRYRPASRYTLNGGSEIKTSGGALLFEFTNFNSNPEEIKREYDQEVKSIMPNYNYLKSDCENFNNSLLSFTNNTFNQRKEQLLRKNNLLSGLGVPIIQRKGVSNTFTVPAPKVREKITIRPTVTAKGFKPEPTLDNEIYQKILRLIHDVGSNFERYPSTYRNKGEEDLRDHILLFLQPNFENVSATGESFNKSGKTDILLRHESTNVFIGECKIWKGEKQLYSTIDQLLSYSTWRDTKTAIIFFVQNKEISSALEVVKMRTSEHANYLGFINKADENWYNFRFHMNGDKNREIKLAILLFHLPKYLVT
jgi:hypothetical protein